MAFSDAIVETLAHQNRVFNAPPFPFKKNILQCFVGAERSSAVDSIHNYRGLPTDDDFRF